MPLNPQIMKLESDKLLSYLRVEPCLLFIGAETDFDMLPEILTQQRWSAVITDLPLEQEERITQLFHKFEEVNRTPLLNDSLYHLRANRQEMPIVQIHKFCEAALMDEPDENERHILIRQTMRDILGKLMQPLTHIFVIGCTEKEIPLFDKSICRSSIFFFGMEKDQLQPKTTKLEENYGFVFYSEKLSDILALQTEEESEDVQAPQNLSLSFYIQNTLVSLPVKDMLAVNEFIILANRNAVEAHLPDGKALLRRSFERFLEDSATDSPIWYAYSGRTEFAVPRDYDEGFYRLVKAALNNDNMPDGKPFKQDTPIVLMGAPSSGKTVSLCRLAYRIFQDHEYPVLFMHSRRDIQGEDLENLQALMMRISELNPKGKGMLLIWDCSPYQNPLPAACRLIRRLNGQSGRKCVLVISSYEHQEHRGETRSQYQWEGNSYRACDDEPISDLILTRYLWIVKSPRRLQEKEKRKIRMLFGTYCDIQKDAAWWKRFDEMAESDVFNYFFRLTVLARDPMKQSLLNERNAFNTVLVNRLAELYDANEKGDRITLGSVFGDIFAAFGMAPENINANQPTTETAQKRLHEFELCIAAFSQFALEVPRSLMMCYLVDDSAPQVAYATDSLSSRLFKFVTTAIPWIVYREYNGDFYFRFRNVQEALLLIGTELFSPGHEERDYLDFILSLFEHFRMCSVNGADEKTVHILSAFIREIGPNSRQTAHTLDPQFYEELIQALTDLVDEKLDYGYTLTLTLITLRREYYGNQLNLQQQNGGDADMSPIKRKERYETAMNELISTVLLCNQVLDDIRLNTNYEISQRGQITNEKALCNVRFADVVQAYRKYCEKESLEISPEFQRKYFITSFQDLFSSMELAIRNHYTNGYYYNTIFWLYEKWAGHVTKEARLEYISRMLEIASYASSFGVDSGEEELNRHIATFNTMLSNNNIPTISQINAGQITELFREQYKHAIAEDNPAYILLVAYQELLDCGIGKKQDRIGMQLQSHQIDVCRSVYDYLSHNRGTVNKKGNSLWLMLRVFWLMKTGTEPFSRQERRCTAFNKEEWKVVWGICKDYDVLCSSGQEPIRPFMTYLYALSQMYVQSYRTEKDRFTACQSTLSKIEEGDFDFIYNDMSRRMFTPFLLCDENGEPQLFEGTIDTPSKRDSKNGFMAINGLGNFKIRFRAENIGLSRLPNQNNGKRIFSELVIGVCYTGFQVYAKSKLNSLENRARRNDNE